MKYTYDDLHGYEGALQRKYDQNKMLQQKMVVQLLKQNLHLYGFLIALLTKNIDIFQFLCTAEGTCMPNL